VHGDLQVGQQERGWVENDKYGSPKIKQEKNCHCHASIEPFSLQMGPYAILMSVCFYSRFTSMTEEGHIWKIFIFSNTKCFKYKEEGSQTGVC
jgi:hypothetical protein